MLTVNQNGEPLVKPPQPKPRQNKHHSQDSRAAASSKRATGSKRRTEMERAANYARSSYADLLSLNPPDMSDQAGANLINQAFDDHNRVLAKNTNNMNLPTDHQHHRVPNWQNNTGNLASAEGGYQSKLLSKYAAKPSLPGSSSIHEQIANERGTTTLSSTSKTAWSHGMPKSSSITRQQNNLDQARGTRQSNVTSGASNRKRIIGQGLPPTGANRQTPLINKVKKQPISHLNQNEIMERIFGSNKRYQQFKQIVQKPSDRNYSPDKNQSRGREQIHKQQEIQQNLISQQNSLISANMARLTNNDHTKQAQVKSPVHTMKLREINSINNSQMQPKRYNNQDQQFSSPNDENSEPTDKQLEKANDEVEKAFMELKEAQNAYQRETTEFKHKSQTHTNGFFAAHKTQSSTFVPNSQTQSNFYQQNSNNNGAVVSSLGRPQIKLIDDETIEEHDLKERLYVAERVMKALFERNKQLEQQDNQVQSNATSSNSCASCNTFLQKIQNLEKEIQVLKKDKSGDENNNNQDFTKNELYILVQSQLESVQSQSKMHLESYFTTRDQLNELLEKGYPFGNDHKQNLQKERNVLIELTKQMKIAVQQQDQDYQARVKELDQFITNVKTQFEGKNSVLKKKEFEVQQLNEEIERRKHYDSRVKDHISLLVRQNAAVKDVISQVEEYLDETDSISAKYIKQILKKADIDVADEEEESDQTEDDQEPECCEVNDL